MAAAHTSSYLKSYPYLFVRETNQTDYFCTLCDAFQREDELQAHLFDGHRAQTQDDLFVRVATAVTTGTGGQARRFVYVCVVCWAKVSTAAETVAHRLACRPEENGNDMKKTLNGGCGDRDYGGKLVIDLSDSGEAGGDSASSRHPKDALQCNLCSAAVVSAGFPAHLRDFHRVTCSLEDVRCPLCADSVHLAGLSLHLCLSHGLAPHAASNAILLWVLASSSFAQAKTKTLPEQLILQQQQQQQQLMLRTPKLKSLKDVLGPLQPHPPQPPSANSSPSRNPGLLLNPNAQIPTVLQSLLSGGGVNVNGCPSVGPAPAEPARSAGENIVSKFTQCHVGANGKESIQCLVCSKWFAVPPVKHLRIHMIAFKDEKRRLVPLVNGLHVCIICYEVFPNLLTANAHLAAMHDLPFEFGGGGLGGGGPGSHNGDLSDHNASNDESSDIPTVIDGGENPRGKKGTSIELDNAGRVKSGKVRKQCELCGEWSNIKWFFKHMSEVHQALFCRCCREYLPIPEQEEHRKWHAEPPYMGQKIRLEAGRPVIVDRKERASLTPIGSLAAWGGSSGGKVVRAVDIAGGLNKPKKRKAAAAVLDDPSMSPSQLSLSPLKALALSQAENQADLSKVGPVAGTVVKDTLMPKETCPVCGILITYKNLARHIKLRHKIKFKFCHKCRKLIANQEYEEHRSTCDGAAASPDEDATADADIDAGHGLDPDLADETSNASSIKDESVDPMQFLETASYGSHDEDDDDMDDGAGGPHMLSSDARKSESFRANTSKNKLESLLGKEFKHPRRRCAICGYTVSYSNFKRHLRNAHPIQYSECEKNPVDFKQAMYALSESLGDWDPGLGEAHSLGGRDDQANSSDGFLGHILDDEDDDQDMDDEDDKREQNFTECTVCGDSILADFMERHMKTNHAEDRKEDAEKEAEAAKETEAEVEEPIATVEAKDTEDEPLRQCPVCSEKLRPEAMIKHCKSKHKVTFCWCKQCSKYIMRKLFASHLKKQHGNDHHDAEAEQPSSDVTGGDDVSKVFNCAKCSHMFLSKDAFSNHQREAHPEDEDEDKLNDEILGEDNDGDATAQDV